MPKKKKSDEEVQETEEIKEENLENSEKLDIKEVIPEDKKEVVLAPLETYKGFNSYRDNGCNSDNERVCLQEKSRRNSCSEH